MILTANSQFTVTLLADDERTGYKKGTVFYPKGVYWTGKNGKDLVLVGDKNKDHTIRLAFPAKDVDVVVTG